MNRRLGPLVFCLVVVCLSALTMSLSIGIVFHPQTVAGRVLATAIVLGLSMVQVLWCTLWYLDGDEEPDGRRPNDTPRP